MRAKRIAFLLIAVAFVSVLIIVGCLLNRETIKRADYLADWFGFPYYWLEHVRVTFAGQTDCWNIIIWNFAMNVVLFFMVSTAALCLTLILKSNRN